MKGQHILLLTLIYFVFLVIIARITGKNDSNADFFKAGKQSPWFLVAFGMIGASLSGVTFISVPGWVEASEFSYFQVCLGYIAGYVVVAFLLLPVYYRLNLTSIYEYLQQRFGNVSHKTGAFFFFVSRVLGAAFRMYLMAIVLQQFVFEQWGIPFEMTVVLSIVLIWVYTNKGGIKTIVWTDTLQTLFMVCAVILSIYMITDALGWSFAEFLNSDELKQYSTVFQTESILDKDHFLKSFFGGMFITICMTGLDQDMMQKNLTCKTLKDAQKNMLWFSLVDLKDYSESEKKHIRKKTHIGMSILLILVIIAFKYLLNSNVIDSLLTVAGYTYGPLLGLFAFGIFTNYKVKDQWVWCVALASVALSYTLGETPTEFLGGYVIGYELLPLNGLLTFLGLVLIRRK